VQLSIQDVTKLFNLPEKTIHRWIQNGEIPVHRVCEQYRFNRAELMEWALQKGLHVSPHSFPAQENQSGVEAGLADSLEQGGIFYQVDGTDKESVLRSVLHHMNLPDEIDRNFLLEMILVREELASTAVGDGVAIPHVRSPIVLHVNRPLIALFFLKNPIDFGALDGIPVNILFSLITPTTRIHLQLLSRLAFALRDAEFKYLLKREGHPEEILEAARQVDSDVSRRASSTGKKIG
jgi:PTS system nitrogen regulatory IIA component